MRARHEGVLQGANAQVPDGAGRVSCGWRHPGPGTQAAATLHCTQVVDAFLKLEKPYQDAIAEVTQKMGAGMAEFIEKEVSAVALPTTCHGSVCLVA